MTLKILSALMENRLAAPYRLNPIKATPNAIRNAPINLHRRWPSPSHMIPNKAEKTMLNSRTATTQLTLLVCMTKRINRAVPVIPLAVPGGEL